MSIPLSYYITYWCKGTLLALCTGALIVVLIPPILAMSPYFALLSVFVYQFFIYRYFWGNRRGDFEYKYRVALIENALSNYIFTSFGLVKYIRYKLDNLNQIRSFQLSILNEALKLNQNADVIFLTNLKLAELYAVNEDYSKEKTSLSNSVNLKNHDLVANLKMAICFERSGEGENAIYNYEQALKDPQLYSDRLKNFITEQIERVRTVGPQKRPPIPGLRYVTW